jgi:predicted nucleotidyltransferase
VTSAPPDLSRYDDVLAWLRACAAADPDIRALWLGGSVATGGYDDWSDVDVEVLCTPGTSYRVIESMMSAVDLHVESVWRLPVGTWPDGRQSFLTLNATPGDLAAPTRIVDLHVHDDTPEARRVDARRHGQLMVLHDPDGIVEQADDDERDLVRRRVREIEQIRQRRDVAGWLVSRAIARDQPAEAVALYLRLGLMAVVTLVRNEICPWRFDYGLRYLHTDLPTEQRVRVESLLPGVDDLGAVARRCFAWMDALLADRPSRGSVVADGDRRRVLVGLAVREDYTEENARDWLTAFDDQGRPGTVTTSVDGGVLLVEHAGLSDAEAAAWLRTWQQRTSHQEQ